jgi:hypothetical protein
MSKIEVDAIEPQSGTTLTIGASSDTITIPSGATLDASSATLTLPDGSVTTAKLAYDPNPFRNIIINGDMSIAQRSTSVASITTTGYYTVDRFKTGTSIGTFTQSQSTDVPTGEGFATSLKMDCTTANASPGAANGLYLLQGFEGQNLQYLKKGTANAVSLTASFWVKSTKTGTFILELNDPDNVRSISKSYTVDVTDTWEKKTITFEGDTTGTLNNDNDTSLNLFFWLGAGSNFTSGTLNTTWNATVTANRVVGQVNIADSTANDFYITGVQLEAGTTASDFEFLPVDVNLDRCERYYQIISKDDNSTLCNAVSYTTTRAYGVFNFKKEMRAVPSLDQTSGVSWYQYVNVGQGDNFDSFTLALGTTRNCRLNNDDTITITVGQSGWFANNNVSSFVAVDAEL